MPLYVDLFLETCYTCTVLTPSQSHPLSLTPLSFNPSHLWQRPVFPAILSKYPHSETLSDQLFSRLVENGNRGTL